MWPVAQRYLDALGGPHRIVTSVTATPTMGDAVTLELKSGTVGVDDGARVRRKASLDVLASAADYSVLSQDGTVIRVDHGIDFGGTEQITVPVFTGEVVKGSQRLGDGSVSLQCADLWTRITRCRFLTPYSPNPSTSRVAAITSLVEAAIPGTTVTSTASDTGAVGTQVWQESRADAISDIAAEGGMDAFFLPDGSFLIRDTPTTQSSPVWGISAGAGGTLKSGERERPKDRMYNTVIVRPSSADGSQTWGQQVAQVTDPANPRHPDRIGVVPYFWASPTITDAFTALSIARRILDRVLGSTETISLGAVSNAALEGGDVIRVTTPAVNDQPADIFQHFIDGLRLDLVTGGMSLSTRSQSVA